MERRRFLSNLLSGATALAIAPALLRGESAFAGDSADFAAGLDKHPWLAGWKSMRSESLGPLTLQVEGRLPEGFAGTLYRNGPALFERDGFRYEHWFDGDGMVHGWRFDGRGVTHRARMVVTSKYTREQKDGRFRIMAVGTTVPDPLSIRNNDDANTANTAVTMINGRLFALWEGGSAFELDPDSLQTLGPVTWREDLASLPYSAHPLRDRDGSSWNFGALSMLGSTGLLVWHIGADGKLIRASILDTPQSGYLHSFAMTGQHLVFVLTPFRFEQGGAFFERLRFTPDQGCRVAVVDKSNPDQARWFEVDFAMAYHFGDAYEKDGRIVVRTVQHPDPEEARSPMQRAMRGGVDPANFNARLLNLHLDLRNGKARWEDTGITGLEFPQFDPRTRGDRAARLFTPLTQGKHDAPYFNAVAAFDVERGRRQVHRYGESILAEEHVFVPKPGHSRAGEGWLVGTLLDSARGRSGISVLDAQHVDRGPLAQAWLPYTFPLGFHGQFASR